MPDAFETARAWFDRRTYRPTSTAAAALATLKGDQRISVVLPARNEESTIGPIVTAIREALQDKTGLVEEILVIDSRSGDATAQRSREAGARVCPAEDEAKGDGGKGAAMRTGLARMTGDIGVYLDADVVDFGVDFVVGLLEPLLTDPTLVLVKAFYDRPWTGSEESRPTGGGRVTELVARPMVQRRAPLLAGFAQPLAGECAFRRAALLPLPFVSGYGVDIGLLLKVLENCGLDAMAQVDLGRRVHRHQDLDALGRMALQVAAAFELCLDDRLEVTESRAAVTRNEQGQVVLSQEEVTTRMLAAVRSAASTPCGKAMGTHQSNTKGLP